MQVKKISAQQSSPAKGPIIFDTNQSSSTVVVAVRIAVKALLAAYPKSRSLGRFFTARMAKPLNPFIGSKSHIRDYVFSVIVANQQPLSTVQRVNKIRQFTTVYGFYFTQCVCTGSIERSTLFLNIYIMYS